MVFIDGARHPYRKLTRADDAYLKFQVDNGLAMGWSRKDLIILTNFQWSHAGVDATVVADRCDYCPAANWLLSAATIIRSQRCDLWYHHHNVIQIAKLETMYDIVEDADLGVVQSGSATHSSSIFIRRDSLDLIESLLLRSRAKFKRHGSLQNTDAVLGELITNHVGGRIKLLDQTYNLIEPSDIDQLKLRDIKIIELGMIDGDRWGALCSSPNPIIPEQIQERLWKYFYGIDWIPIDNTILAKRLTKWLGDGITGVVFPVRLTNPTTGQLEVYLDNVDYVEKWIDQTLTLFIAAGGGDVVGYRVSGVSSASGTGNLPG